MPIDWFTVVAQIINFLILVWLLKRFLYQPILKAIDARENEITRRLSEAEAKDVAAKKECDEFRGKNDAFEKDREHLFNVAVQESLTERQRLLEEARTAADTLTSKRQEGLRIEQRHLVEEITHWTRKEVFAIARKTLADLATISLEERMVEVFIHRLNSLAQGTKETMTASLKSPNNSCFVRSAFDLTLTQRNMIEMSLKNSFAADGQFRFETVPEIISGIELVIDGQKVTWSVGDYLAMLEKSVGELLKDGTVTDVASTTRKVEVTSDANDRRLKQQLGGATSTLEVKREPIA